MKRITRKRKAPKTTELIEFLKGEIHRKSLKVGDVLFTTDNEKMLVPEGFHKPTAQEILNISVRAGVLERAGLGKAIVTDALRDYSVRKILGIIKRRHRVEKERAKGEKKGRRTRQLMRVSDTVSSASSPVSAKNVNVIDTLVDECSLEELMTATHEKAVRLLEKEINEKTLSLGRLKEEMKRLGLVTAS